jgi:ribosomal protein L39E
MKSNKKKKKSNKTKKKNVEVPFFVFLMAMTTHKTKGGKT